MSEPIYRIQFVNHNAIYEIYAKDISDGVLFGFIQVVNPIFGSHTQVVVDPAEERLKNEFDGVDTFYVPVHQVIRIDEVAHGGTPKVKDLGKDSNVTPFPLYSRGSDS